MAYITNVIVVMVTEFHLTSSCFSLKHCCPVIPPFIEDELSPIKEYLSEEDRGMRDAWTLNEAATKRIAVWLHRLEMIAVYREERSFSILEQDHDECDLVKFLLYVGTCSFSESNMIAQVVAENVERVYGLLCKAQQSYDSTQSTYDGLVEKEKVVETELGNIPEGHPSKKQKSDELLRLRNQKERSQTMMETHMNKMDSLNRWLMEAGLLTPPESLDGEDNIDSPSDTSSEVDMQVEEVEEEEVAEREAPALMSVEGTEELDLNVGAGEPEAKVEGSGVITEAEDCFLDTPTAETTDGGLEAPTDTPPVESPGVQAEDRWD